MNNKVAICGTELSLLDVEGLLNELSISLSNSRCMLSDLMTGYFRMRETKIKAEPSILIRGYEEHGIKASIALDYIIESQAKIEEVISCIDKEIDNIHRQDATS